MLGERKERKTKRDRRKYSQKPEENLKRKDRKEEIGRVKKKKHHVKG